MAKGEFERIAAYFAPLAAEFPGAFGLLDDAAALTHGPDQTFIVSTDTIVEGVHFIGNEPADLIARKLLRVSVSDLAAMGASPHAYTLNVALNPDVNDAWLEAFVSGLAADQAEFAIDLAGGDSVSTTGPIVLTTTVFGVAATGKAVRRSGASVGDGIYVSGSIGDGALGLQVAKGLISLEDAKLAEQIVSRYHVPQPRTALGRRLGEVATAAADVSDGLLADLAHVMDASGVAAEIELSKVPLSPAAMSLLARDAGFIPVILTGGDDYELVFTSANEAAVKVLATETKTPIARIGSVKTGRGVDVLNDSGELMAFEKTGFRHG